MKTAGIRNTPVDRRYLSDQDKSDYNQSGAYGQRAQAVSRTRAYRGNMAYQANRPKRTVTQTPGTGGTSLGRIAQPMRQMEIGDNKRRSESFRPDKENIYEGIYS